MPRFVRVLLMGGDDITGSIAERLGLPMDEAEGLKRSTGYAPVLGAFEPDATSRAIESSAGAFVEEVRGSLDYYLAQSGSARVGRVVVSGGGARLTGLVERLSAATRLPVEVARPLSQLRVGRTGLSEADLAEVEPLVSVPVGLALGVAS